MVKQRVLVIEDDNAIRQGIVDALGCEGYQTFEAARGDAGLNLAVQLDYELLLLDLVLPGGDGLSILKEVRAARPTQPVIIVTARGEERDRIQGLKLGADDYVIKPFSVKELLARVEAVLRRSPERPQGVRCFALPQGQVDLERREVRFVDGQATDLSTKEADLLRYLACNAGRPLSREEILWRVWHITPTGVETRTIDMHVARLREKLRDDPDAPRVLRTIRGKGYMFCAGDDAP